MQIIPHFIGLVVRAIGPYRTWRLLDTYKQKYEQDYVALLEYFLAADWPKYAVRESFLRKYLGDHKSRFGARIALAKQLGTPFIDSIPSETTPAERRLLYMLFRYLWGGIGNVFEVGPFLGGTTRAIAMGMLENPNRSPESQFFTADKFSGYYGREALEGYLKPLFNNGTLNEEDRNAIGHYGSFRQIFERIHARQAYSSFLKILDGSLPDLPEISEAGLNLAAIAPVTAFFNDGCKSWYGTKYFLKQAALSAAPNAWFIFQDYGMYTCFWIPLCLHLLRDHFRLLMFTDCTYIWVQTCSFTPDEVERTIPDRAESLDLSRVQAAFDEMLNAAHEREDRRALVSYRLQHAAVLAYRGDLDEARRMIDELKRRDEALGYEDLIARARKSPTYRPKLGDPAWESIYLD